jgi:hypothetical protein
MLLADVRSRPCNECQAKPGRRCHGSTYCHRSRWEAAERARKQRGLWKHWMETFERWADGGFPLGAAD